MIADMNLMATQFIALWAVLDPVGHLTLFMGATDSLSARERRRAASLSVLFAFIILSVFGIAGQFLLQAMGVSLLSFQIAGGIILLLFAINMVLGAQHQDNGRDASRRGGDTPPAPAETKAGAQAPALRSSVLDIAVYPLAVPIIAGPGAMLTIVVLMDNNRDSITHQMETIGVLALVMLILLALFQVSGPVMRLIGVGGSNLLRRVMGLILSAVAVNLILNALANWLKLPPI